MAGSVVILLLKTRKQVKITPDPDANQDRHSASSKAAGSVSAKKMNTDTLPHHVCTGSRFTGRWAQKV